MKKIFLIFISILLFGCSEDEQNPETTIKESFNLTTENSSVMPLGFVIVNTDVPLSQDTYSGKFGNQEIELKKSSDNELVFLIPEINQGNQLLELTIGNKSGNLDFQVLNNDVQNIEQVIANEVITPFNSFNNEITNLLNSNVYNEEITTQLETSQLILNNYLTQLSQISNDEKREVARFFNANPIFTTDYLNLEKRNSSFNPAWDCLRDNKAKIVLTSVGIVAFVKIIVLSGSTPIGPIAAAVGVTGGIYAAVSIVSAINESVLDECFLPIENLLNDSEGNSDNFEIDNNSFEPFSIKTKIRHLISTDVNGNNAIVSILISKLNYIKSKWLDIKNYINDKVSNATSWFCGWFSSGCPNYNLITYDFEGIPNSSDEFETPGDSEFIFIEDFPSDVDVEVNIASDNSINLKFNSDENSLPRTVTGKIKYDDGDFITTNDFSVTIEDVDIHPSWATGAWFWWHNQGFESNDGTGCWTTITRNIDGQTIYFRYYPESFFRYILLSDGTATQRQPTQGCEDVPGDIENGTWSVRNNVLEIIINGELYFQLNDFNENNQTYEKIDEYSGVYYLDYFQR
ncbi:hypothetical protein AAFN75_14215 [Algibacter sp. AS12]|uniref:hypothetical protein n=1 Tax=Algibacter sp. AS12 TaxID=3135773 RepID=UPI00398BBB77